MQCLDGGWRRELPPSSAQQSLFAELTKDKLQKKNCRFGPFEMPVVCDGVLAKGWMGMEPEKVL